MTKVSVEANSKTDKINYKKDHEVAILIILKEDRFVAYQNACTHLQCPVFWEESSHNMICPCHHGVFDPETGSPTAGPPRRALPEIELKIDDGVEIGRASCRVRVEDGGGEVV